MKTSLLSTVAAPQAEAAEDFPSALARFDAHASGEDWLALMTALNRGDDAETAFVRGVRNWASRHGGEGDGCGH